MTWLEIVIWMSLLVTGAQVYLRVNKLWKRKHESEVASSISPYGNLLLWFNCLLWIWYYIDIEDDPASAIDSSLFMLETSIFILVSSGLFVKTTKKIGLWASFRKQMKLERKEADYLIKKFFKPANAEKIIRILHELAMIDEDLDPKERELIEKFAKEWDIEYSSEIFNSERKVDHTNNFVSLRDSVKDYLESQPQPDQVAHLKDMMEALIKVDSTITKQEELIFEELTKMIADHLNKGSKLSKYHVLIVPQKEAQESIIQHQAREAKKMQVSGGEAYSVGSYFSHQYADLICKMYRDMNLFTIVFNPDEEMSLLMEKIEKEKDISI